MRIIIAAVFLLAVFTGAVSYVFGSRKPPLPAVMTPAPTETVRPSTMFLKSPAFTDSGIIPAKYTCDGENVNPPLVIGNIPDGTKSLVLLTDDIDTPKRTWVHWLVWNIDPETNEIPESAVFPGAGIARNGFGKLGYGGPCPSEGIHRYVFTVYAVDRILLLDQDSQKSDVLNAANTRILGSAQFIGKYSRPK